jgi:hypothetical protein
MSDQGVPYANVLLLSPLDSSLIKGELTDDNGTYSFREIAEGKYLIGASYIGFENSYSDVINVLGNTDISVPDITMTEGITLDQVQVVAKKPLYEQKIDRLIVNVSNSITSAGGTALEVLERSPGVVVNQQNNAISLIGKEGVVIMINGKISYQPSESIVQMLSGMTADNIESIELITTPPANLDAEGNAGYINIVLKQRTDLGFNGSASTSIGYGEGETGSVGLNMNYRKGIVNIFSTYNFSLQAQKQIFTNYRKVTRRSEVLENEIFTDRDPQQLNHNLRIGADFQFSPNTVMGVLLSAYDNKWTMSAFNTGINSIDQQIGSQVALENEEENRWKHFGANFNIEHQFDNSGKLNFNANYLYYHDNNPNTYDIQYLDPNGSLLAMENTRSSKVTPLDISVAQIDYSNSVNDNLSFMTGVKWVHSTFMNTVSAETQNNGPWEFIDQFTNESDLKEDVAAAFTSIDYVLDKNNIFKFGLRYEHTDSKLNTIKEGNVVDRQFGVLFPSIFYSRTINENQNLNLSYSKRITRPTFNDMAPFAIFLDPNTFFFGNASLQPAITNNIKLDYRYKSYLISFQYAREDSTIASFQDKIDIENNQQLFAPVNLSNTNTYSTSLAIPLYIGKRYTIQNNFILLYQEANSFYEGTPINQTNTSYNFNTTHSIVLDDFHSFEVNAFYNSTALMGRAKMDAMYAINFGFQKKFSNGSSLRFNVRDMLNSLEMNGGTNIPSLGFITDGSWDFSNRTFSVTYNFNFGNSRLKSSRERGTGSDAERQRVN